MSLKQRGIEADLAQVSGAVLTPIRWVVLLGILASLRLHFGLPRMDRAAVVAAVAFYAVAAAGLPCLRGRLFTPQVITRLLPAADLLFSAAIFHFTDGSRSPYFGLWYLALINAALVLEAWASLGLALGAAALVVAGEWTLRGPEALGDLNLALGKLPFLLLIAWSAARLAQELREREAARRQVERRALILEGEEARRRQELETARRVQESLMPLAVPTPSGLTLAALSHPAREVGGDTYHLVELPDGQILVAIADVSGKGMPAALLTVAVQQAVRQFTGPEPAAVPAGVNHLLLGNNLDQMFVTAACVVIDPRSGAAANAGHPPLLWWNQADQRLEPVSGHGPILGIVSSWRAPTERWQLSPGDMLILYPDGVLDAKTGPDERLGEERLAEILERPAPESAADWIERLRRALNECPECPDDITAVAIRWEPARAAAAGAARRDEG